MVYHLLIVSIALVNYCLFQREFSNANFIAMDTICKYWPWLIKLDPTMATRQQPFLSVMHAKAHSWACQVSYTYLYECDCLEGANHEITILGFMQNKWSGKVQDGCGESSGETTELANSFMSRPGLVTRYMTPSGKLCNF